MSRPASPRRSQRATNSPKSGWRNVTEGTCTAAESPKAHFSKDESAPHASLVIALGHEAVMRTMGPYAVCSRLLWPRSEEHTSELQSLMRSSYAVFCLKKKIKTTHDQHT